MQKKILLVDDDLDFIDLYSKLLGGKYKVSAVTSLKDCVTYLKNHAYEVDLIICDIFMPEVDGFEVYDFLKSNDEYSFYPVVFKTSSLSESVASKVFLEKSDA